MSMILFQYDTNWDVCFNPQIKMYMNIANESRPRNMTVYTIATLTLFNMLYLVAIIE